MDTKLFAAFWTDVMGEIPGKKAFQKLVYFGQVLGIPFKQSYRMHYFGPYSESVARELSDAEEFNIIQIKMEAISFWLEQRRKLTLRSITKIFNQILMS